MKSKVTYALLLLLCCTLGASSNRNTSACDAMKNGSSLLPVEKVNTEAEADAAIPSVTGYLPGYSILFN